MMSVEEQSMGQRMEYAKYLMMDDNLSMATQILIPNCKQEHQPSLLLMGRLKESLGYDKEAFTIYNKLYHSGFYKAAIPLANCYLNGVGIESHIVEAVHILESALDYEIEAYHELGMIYNHYKSKRAKPIFKQGKSKGCLKCKQELKKLDRSNSFTNKLFNI